MVRQQSNSGFLFAIATKVSYENDPSPVSPVPQCLVLRFALFTGSRKANCFDTDLKGSLSQAGMDRGGMLPLDVEVEDAYIGGPSDLHRILEPVGTVFRWPGDNSVQADPSLRPYSCTRGMH